MAPRACVLVVDDDASIRRFVAMALEGLDIRLLIATNVAEALALLSSTGPVDVLMTDLMMPGATGVDLLQALVDSPALRGSARFVVFSAGVDAVRTERLRGLGVWRQLSKPVAVAELVACVEEALGVHAVATGMQEVPASPPQVPQAAPAPLAPGQVDALHGYFGGDRTLFLAYHAACIRQLAQDIRQGDSAAAARNADALRRLAHNLKGVMATLGHGQIAVSARALEDACVEPDWVEVLRLWAALRELVVGLVDMVNLLPDGDP